LKVSSKLVLREFVSERAYFATGYIPVAVTKIGSTCRKWVELFDFVSCTEIIKCGRCAMVCEYVELFGSGKIGESALFVLWWRALK
jgi:hypothetical protein